MRWPQIKLYTIILYLQSKHADSLVGLSEIFWQRQCLSDKPNFMNYVLQLSPLNGVSDISGILSGYLIFTF